MPLPPPKNRLLATLPEADLQRLIAASQLVDLPMGTVLFETERTPRHHYFLLSGIASIVFTSRRGTTIELATLGNEGVVGWMYLLGPHVAPMECFMQAAGQAYRVPVPVLQREFMNCEPLRRVVLEYAQHQGILANQIVACNRLHRAEARLARWLLMVQDRVHSDTIQMTHEFLSSMLGTRRTTVTEVSAILQKAGAIEARRGMLRIVDRSKLEGFACECYPTLKRLLDELYLKS